MPDVFAPEAQTDAPSATITRWEANIREAKDEYNTLMASLFATPTTPPTRNAASYTVELLNEAQTIIAHYERCLKRERARVS